MKHNTINMKVSSTWKGILRPKNWNTTEYWFHIYYNWYFEEQYYFTARWCFQTWCNTLPPPPPPPSKPAVLDATPYLHSSPSSPSSSPFQTCSAWCNTLPPLLPPFQTCSAWCNTLSPYNTRVPLFPKLDILHIRQCPRIVISWHVPHMLIALCFVQCLCFTLASNEISISWSWCQGLFTLIL